MAKTGGKVKLLREKQKKFNMRNSHGGFARFSKTNLPNDHRVGGSKTFRDARSASVDITGMSIKSIPTRRQPDNCTVTWGTLRYLNEREIKPTGYARFVSYEPHADWELYKAK